jgi:hypothetical protein
VKLKLGPFCRCLVCADSHHVESAMRMVHVMARHPVLAVSFLAEDADIAVLFEQPEIAN